MTDPIQCANCGAVLAEEDIFCGECGAPRPALAESPVPVKEELAAAPEVAVAPEPPPQGPPAPSPGPPPPPAQSPPSSEAGWRVAFIVLVVLGILACLAGVLAFLLMGSVGGETTTPQEDWLIGSLCCLLPIGGTGIILAAAGVAIWYTRLRSR